MTESVPHAAVVYHPLKADLPGMRTAIAAAEKDAGWGETRWYATSLEETGTDLARQAVDEGATLIFAAGGDGTVRLVAEALERTEVPLALLPSGTGNLLARNIDIPIGDLLSSAEIGFSGVTTKIDMGRVHIYRGDGGIDHHGFLVMAGIGLDATIMDNTNDTLKKTVGWLAYVDAGFRSLTQARPFKLRYQLDGRAERTLHVTTILFGNCGKLPGGFDLLPDARIDDGELDLAILHPRTFADLIRAGFRLSWRGKNWPRTAFARTVLTAVEGKHKEKSVLTFLRTPKVRVRLEDEHPIELDGDTFGVTQKIEVETRQGVLGVRVPVPAVIDA